MASTKKLEKKVNKAISRAEHAIEHAKHEARALDRKTRAKADALDQRLAKAVAQRSLKAKKAPKVKAPKVEAPKVKAPTVSKAAEIPAAQSPDYRTVAMLRGQARAAGVRGYSSMSRAQLMDVLERT